MKSIRLQILKLAFSLIYAGAAAFFTVTFFRSITGDGLVPAMSDSGVLRAAHMVCLPLLVFVLECASAHAACQFWEAQRARAGAASWLSALMVLACMQAFPVAATFTQTRLRDFHEMESRVLDAQEKETAALGDARRHVESVAGGRRDQAALLQKTAAELEGTLRNYRAKYDRLLKTHAAVRSLEDQREVERLQTEIRKLDSERLKVVSAITSLTPSAEISSVRTEASAAAPRQPTTPLQFVLRTLWSVESLFAAAVAMLFPISVIGVAFALTSEGLLARVSAPRIDLEAELERIAQQPADQQPPFVDSLRNVLAAYLRCLSVYRQFSFSQSVQYANASHFQQFVTEVAEAKRQVISSRVAAERKETLLHVLDDLLQQETLSTSASAGSAT